MSSELHKFWYHTPIFYIMEQWYFMLEIIQILNYLGLKYTNYDT